MGKKEGVLWSDGEASSGTDNGRIAKPRRDGKQEKIIFEKARGWRKGETGGGLGKKASTRDSYQTIERGPGRV